MTNGEAARGAPQWLGRLRGQVEMVEHQLADGTRRLAPHWTHRHPRVRDVNDEFRQSFTPLERVALAVTVRVGSAGFFLIIAGWTALWLVWNTVAPRPLRFDPAPAFVLWLFISNMVQILLLPLIMVGQTLLGRHADLRAESDFEINQKAEQEVEAILLHLEHQTAVLERQSEMMLQVLGRLESR